MGQMNVVPFIDVMLVLLVAIMLAAPLISSGVTVDLPRGTAPPIDSRTIEEGEFLVLSINADAKLYLSVGEAPDSPIDEETVMRLASGVLRRDPSTPVFIRADRSVSYGQVVRGRTLLTQAGASRVVELIDSTEFAAEW